MAWSIIPFVNMASLAVAAAKDALAQTSVGEARCLLIGNGASDEDRRLVERFCLDNPRALAWFHEPSLPSLAATWNRALKFVWETGGEDAMVLNNDVKLTSDTFSTLRQIMQDEDALLVTATGVEEEETLFAEVQENGQESLAFLSCERCKARGTELLIDEEVECGACGGNGMIARRGGPGFSCFLISKECHEKYQFDEMLVPAFTEDLDLHRQMILGGDGDKIFGTNVRYLHLGGQTLKNMSPERRQATEEAISRGARAHYARKWGGGGNEERWLVPFQDNVDAIRMGEVVVPGWIDARWINGESVATPDLFNELRSHW